MTDAHTTAGSQGHYADANQPDPSGIQHVLDDPPPFHTRLLDYGERFFIISIEEAECLELFGPGPLSARARERLGDLIVISSGADVIEYVPSGSIDRLLSITAHHSGLTPAEMRVPLVVV